MDGQEDLKKFRLRLEKFKIDEFKSLFTFYYSGFNIRSTDFNASLGLEQTKKNSQNFKNKEKKIIKNINQI